MKNNNHTAHIRGRLGNPFFLKKKKAIPCRSKRLPLSAAEKRAQKADSWM